MAFDSWMLNEYDICIQDSQNPYGISNNPTYLYQATETYLEKRFAVPVPHV